ncbi:unnamed protein product [Prorocentrum cordatum]|uniref:Uncharacterized protein n=1 Tax=Prorocentrum cordatum TaxID=2364126 RepID=A0ABN9UJ37_9DINO|nr:unnamed protein product [Polarella glacialis]
MSMQCLVGLSSVLLRFRLGGGQLCFASASALVAGRAPEHFCTHARARPSLLESAAAPAGQMVDNTPWFVFMNRDDDARGQPASNAGMVEGLRRSRALQSQECTDAFLAVDRRHFWTEGAGEREFVYADTPLRSGKLHLSAPHIYAKVLWNACGSKFARTRHHHIVGS